MPTPPAARTVSVDLEVLVPPATTDLVFWALQVSFVEGHQRTGGGHTGLQWHSGHPDSTAINWGGYHTAGGILNGTESHLPSATGNDNTRDFPWEPGARYTLTIEPGHHDGWWSASITDTRSGVHQHIRELEGGGRALVSPLVWSEVFAPCDAPSTEVRWSNPRLETLDGSTWRPTGYRLSFQEVAQGGCSNTNVTTDGIGARQRTACARDVRAGSTIPIR